MHLQFSARKWNMSVKVQTVQIAECALPLPRPIRLGPVSITHREFVALRLIADNGMFGDALGYPRGGPLIEAAERMASQMLGGEIHNRRGVVDGFLQNHVNNRPSFIKAASLYDIAMWDLAAKAAALPLHQMLGSAAAEVPVMVVAGYFLDQRTVADVCREVEAFCAEGFTRIKVMISGTNPQFDADLVGALHAIAGDRLSVDAHWAFRSVQQAYEGLRRIDDLGLRFIEDPFGPYQANLYPALKQFLKTPVASGEDLPDAQSLSELSRHLPILRIDATTCGGITGAQSIIEFASLMGAAVLPHVFLPVHAQLAGAHRSIEAVEMIPIESGACPMFDLLEEPPQFRQGNLVIDQTPGAGFRLRWDQVQRYARTPVRHFEV
jgi:L-alanine-DL-glutamate epimerase-like enolase superfamily enzyme